MVFETTRSQGEDTNSRLGVAGLAREIVAGSILAVGSTVTVRRAIGMAIGIAGDWVCSTHDADGDGDGGVEWNRWWVVNRKIESPGYER